MLARKGQGISINTIIIAAIALLVLVVLSVIFLGRTGIFARESADCSNKGGQCVVGACPGGTTVYRAFACEKTSEGAFQTCCLPVGA